LKKLLYLFIGLKDWFKNAGKKILGGIRKAEDTFCDMVDYFRYDQGIIATTARAIDQAISTATSIPTYIVSGIIKGTYYGVGSLFGVTKEEMDVPIKIITDYASTKIEQGMNYLANKGINVRFIGDVCSVGMHFFDYYQVGKLSRGGLERIQGIFNESARRYKISKLNQAKQMRDLRNENIDNYLKRCQEKNNQLYKNNDKVINAVKKEIEEDYQKQRKQIKNLIPRKDPKFRERIFQAILNDFWKYLLNLLGNSGWLMKENFKNFINNWFGKMGGFHTCPYGCQRPIPDAFKGCTELLQVFPDYFN